MGVIYLDHFGGKKEIVCKNCMAYLSHWCHYLSSCLNEKRVKGLLMAEVSNTNHHREAVLQYTCVGDHYSRDVECKRCNSVLGYYCEYFSDPSQRFKERCYFLYENAIRVRKGDSECYHPAIDN